jgi:NADH:ubiquinone oxidoreductase subunit K
MKSIRWSLKLVNSFVLFLVYSYFCLFARVFETLDLYIVGYFIILFLFIWMKDHFFITLIYLEFIMLTVLMKIMCYINYGVNYYRWYYVYLVVVICEAIIGLAILIRFSRFWGNEIIKV